MRQLRLTSTGRRVTLLILVTLLCAGLPVRMPGSAPSAAQAQGAEFTLVRPPDQAGAGPAAAQIAIAGTAPSDLPPTLAGAGGELSVPELTLPRGAGGRPPALIEMEQTPGASPRQAGGMPVAEAAQITFGPARPALASLSGACESLIRNSSIYAYQDPSTSLYNIYNWRILQQNVYVETATYFSYPYALTMHDGDETANPDGRDGHDEDWFGQDFIFPSDGESALIEFNKYYPSGGDVGFDDYDYGYYELYRLDADGNLIDEVPGDEYVQGISVERIDTATTELDTWYRASLFINKDNFPRFDEMKGQRVALIFDQDGDGLPPYERPIIDNPQVTVCPTSERPTNAVEGYVAVNELPLSGEQDQAITTASLALLYRASPTVSPELVRLAYPDEYGYYRFLGLPDLPAGGAYQVMYLNSGYENEATGERLSYYAGPLVSSFPDQNGSYHWGWGGYFDLSNVVLQGPAHYTRVAGDVTFSWSTREFVYSSSLYDRAYFVCFYDPDTRAEVCSKPILPASLADPDVGTYTTSAAALQAVTGFPFEFGKPLGWYVRVASFGYDENTPAYDGIGASRYSQFVTFEQESAPPPPPPAPEATPPPAASGQKSWTLMFYLAGDDDDLTNPEGNARSLVDILANLNQLAETYPSVNVVVQFDFYDSADRPLESDLRGTQRCFFRPDILNLSEACQQLGELNTGDPATLGDFIDAALDRYPANRTALIMIGHGNAVTGVAGDRSTNPVDALRPNEIESAFRAAGLDQAARKLDLLVYYACLMGNFETAAVASQYADYMVASPNIVGLVDISREILGLAADNPTNAQAVAGGIVDAYNSALTGYNTTFRRDLSIAMAAYDLTRMSALRPKVDALAQTLTANLALQGVADMLQAVQRYDSSAPELWGLGADREDALVDLRDLARRLRDGPNSNAALRARAGELLDQLGAIGATNGLVLRSVATSGRADLRSGGTHTFANPGGISIYFPTGEDLGNQPSLTRSYLLYYRQTSFRSGLWDELVDATRTNLPSLPRGGRLASLAAGTPGSTLQNLTPPEVFPTLSTLPQEIVGGEYLFLPLVWR